LQELREEIADAVAVLRRGGLVAFPTETVYGLGCDAEQPEALRRLFAVKRRPPEHPVIVHLASARDLDEWGIDVSSAAHTLAAACWPGPLTLVVKRSSRVPDEVTGGRDTVGLRVPAQRTAHALLAAFTSEKGGGRKPEGGIAAPSANRFGRVSPTTAADVRADLGDDVDLVLDDGPCMVGIESTIVDCSGPTVAILRLGGVPRERVEELLGGPVRLRIAGETSAPGTLAAHYAPSACVENIENMAIPARATALLAAGKRVGVLGLDPPGDLPAGVVVLAPPIDVDDYAHVLYARLRDADRHGLDVLLVVPPPTDGIGAAVADRLTRAAAGSTSPLDEAT
jgi:L-threonylcarbamoyladenylate synthase